ncbi:MAG: hypothetical protein HY872_05130 [Chloroflexi bacterium]|nr:hypothetical protein [Chloroflexota bacterium]
MMNAECGNYADREDVLNRKDAKGAKEKFMRNFAPFAGLCAFAVRFLLRLEAAL